jgi:hypothetical protein
VNVALPETFPFIISQPLISSGSIMPCRNICRLHTALIINGHIKRTEGIVCIPWNALHSFWDLIHVQSLREILLSYCTVVVFRCPLVFFWRYIPDWLCAGFVVVRTRTCSEVHSLAVYAAIKSRRFMSSGGMGCVLTGK